MADITIHYFTAEWCSPCKVFGPKLEAFVTNFKGADIALEKHDVDEEPNLAANLGVKSVPQILLSVDGSPRRSDAALTGAMVSVLNVRESIKRILEL